MGTPCLSRPKKPSLSSIAGALLLLDSWRSPHSPAFPSLASPTSDVGRAESVCCPGSAAKLRGDNESTQTRPCDKICNKNDWILSQYLWAQSQRIAQHHSSPELSSSCTFSWNVTDAGPPYIALVTTRVTGEAQPRKSTGWPMFYLLQSAQNII